MKRYTLMLMAVLMSGCAEPKSYDPAVVGTWENTFLKLETGDMADEDMNYDVFVADTNNWDRVMGAKPVRTTFHADGSLSGEFRNLKDSVYVTSKGRWHTVGDSLHFAQLEPDTFIATYWYRVKQDTLIFKGIVDWARDGMRDDHYYGTQRKLK